MQVEHMKSMIDGDNNQKGGESTEKAEEKMSPELVRLILAPCIPLELNIQYNNPSNNPLCLCETCP